jgi:hypothetical protein
MSVDSLFGLAERILSSLYTCILSKLIITPFIFLHRCKAKSDLPEAVGPAITIIGLLRFILMMHPLI